MSGSILNKKIARFVVLVMLLVFIIGLSMYQATAPSIASTVNIYHTQTNIKPVLPIYGVPVQLLIPSINLSINLESVGIINDGTMGVPIGRDNGAWFDLGPRPGEIGNSVIDGHYGFWVNGEPAVFNNLNKLNKGDVIKVLENNNLVISFAVVDLKIYLASQDDTNIFVSNDNLSHLNIITCQGIWNPVNKTYSSRLVVFANKLNT
ncbi:MAG TPA: class F sortase [Candidatus Dormibacteraeota bacterium]|nr:class F sortase [Candidatus Dormibacteraeota bacterium]